MNSAISLFFASLVSGMLSLADFRPTFSDVVQILTGVELNTQESASAAGKLQQVYSTQPEADKCLSHQTVTTIPALPACFNPAKSARG